MGTVPDALERAVDRFDLGRMVFLFSDCQAGISDWRRMRDSHAFDDGGKARSGELASDGSQPTAK
jgi:hypothetical protein